MGLLINQLSKEQWIEMYGGQELLDREGFDVVPCVKCDDTICHGWRVTPKLRPAESASGQQGFAQRNPSIANLVKVIATVSNELLREMDKAETEGLSVLEGLTRLKRAAGEAIEDYYGEWKD